MFTIPILIISTIFPVWFIVIVLIPILMVLSGYLNILKPVFSIGDIDVQIYDFLLLIAVIKLIYQMIFKRVPIKIINVHKYILIYLGILLLSTIIAYFRFGLNFFLIELSSFLRLIFLFSIIFILFYSIREEITLNHAKKLLIIIGYLIAATVFAAIIIYIFTGNKFGEIHDERVLIRYFGPLGDQVGFILIPFCLFEYLKGKLFNSIFFILPILATGTRGAIIALLFGLFILSWPKIKDFKLSSFTTVISLILLFFLFIYLSEIGQTAFARFFESDIFEEGFSQRTLSMFIAVQVFLDNLFLGIGYNGFQISAFSYDFEEVVQKYGLKSLSNANNQILQIATDAGILGLIGFVLLIISFIKLLNQARSQSHNSDNLQIFNSFKVWLITLLIANQTAVWILPGSILSYIFFIGIALACVQLNLVKSS